MVKQTLESKLQTLETKEENSKRSFAVRSLKARADAKRSFSEKLADWVTGVFGSAGFLILNVTWFALWIVINMGLVPGIKPFDPYPFSFLTMCVSLEAICLAILVLLSQNRQAHLGDVREEIDLHINKISEAEITQIIKMLALVLEKQGLNIKNDPELARMLKPLSSDDIERKIEQQTTRHKKIPIPELRDLPTPPWDPLSKR